LDWSWLRQGQDYFGARVLVLDSLDFARVSKGGSVAWSGSDAVKKITMKSWVWRVRWIYGKGREWTCITIGEVHEHRHPIQTRCVF
jgi:hypothetical protein